MDKITESILKVSKLLDKAEVPSKNRFFRLGDKEYRTNNEGKLCCKFCGCKLSDSRAFCDECGRDQDI